MTGISGFPALNAFKAQIPGKAEKESYQVDSPDHPLPDQPCCKTEDWPCEEAEPETLWTRDQQAQPSEASYWTGRDEWGDHKPPFPFASQKCWLPDFLCRKIQNQTRGGKCMRKERGGGGERREHGCVFWRRDQRKQRGEESHQCSNLRILSRTEGHEILRWKHVLYPQHNGCKSTYTIYKYSTTS